MTILEQLATDPIVLGIATTASGLGGLAALVAVLLAFIDRR